MRTAHSVWVVEVLASLGALAWVYSGVPDEAHTYYVSAELVLLSIAFLATVLLGGPGKVLLVAIALGFAAATLMAIGGSSNCSQDDFICFGPGELFAVGVILAGALYPGWALGTGLGALARLEIRRREPQV
jgi:hypothetical protein